MKKTNQNKSNKNASVSKISSERQALEECVENVIKAAGKGYFNEHWEKANNDYNDPLIMAFPAIKPDVLVVERIGVSKIQYIEAIPCSYSMAANNLPKEIRSEVDREYLKGLEDGDMIVFCLSSNPRLKKLGWKFSLQFLVKGREQVEKEETEDEVDKSTIYLKMKQEEQGLVVAIEYLESVGLYPKYKISNLDVMQANRKNFLSELNGLNQINPSLETFNGCRLSLFKAISACLLNDPSITTEDNEKIFENIRLAGIKMHEVDGMKGLKDPLVWLFIPDSWQGIVNNSFNGIGSWVS